MSWHILPGRGLTFDRASFPASPGFMVHIQTTDRDHLIAEYVNFRRLQKTYCVRPGKCFALFFFIARSAGLDLTTVAPMVKRHEDFFFFLHEDYLYHHHKNSAPDWKERNALEGLTRIQKVPGQEKLGIYKVSSALLWIGCMMNRNSCQMHQLSGLYANIVCGIRKIYTSHRRCSNGMDNDFNITSMLHISANIELESNKHNNQ